MSELADEKTAPDIVVDRDQPVIVTVTFVDGDPDQVYFVYMRPGLGQAHADDGFGQPQSKIRKVEDRVYRYTIDTKGFEGGDGFWKFEGEWDTETVSRPYQRAAIKGVYHVNSQPDQLL
jgi:hypothetical protein